MGIIRGEVLELPMQRASAVECWDLSQPWPAGLVTQRVVAPATAGDEARRDKSLE